MCKRTKRNTWRRNNACASGSGLERRLRSPQPPLVFEDEFASADGRSLVLEFSARVGDRH